jgi:hypothetical protein
VNENWIDVELDTTQNRSIIIKYNEKAVVIEKLDSKAIRGLFDFEVDEEGSKARYLVGMSRVPLQDWTFFVRRNDHLVFITSRNRKEVEQQQSAIKMTTCYEVTDKGKLIEIPVGATNISSSKLYCFVDFDIMTIYLWRGKNTGFVLRIAGEEAAAKLNIRIGRKFSISVIDEDDEPAIFRKRFR